MPSYDTSRPGCGAMRGHEDDKGRGCNGRDDRDPQNHVHDQQNQQKRQYGQRTLEKVVLPVTAKSPVDQSAFKQKATHRPPSIELTHHKRNGILSLPWEICHRQTGWNLYQFSRHTLGARASRPYSPARRIQTRPAHVQRPTELIHNRPDDSR